MLETFGLVVRVHRMLGRRSCELWRNIRYRAPLIGVPNRELLRYLSKKLKGFSSRSVLVVSKTKLHNHNVYIFTENSNKVKTILTTRCCARSALFPTNIIGNSSRSLTLKICLWNRVTSSKDVLSVTENTKRNPSPDLIY